MALVGTITLQDIKIYGRKRRVLGTIVLGDGATAYTVGGIALPTFPSFGFYRVLDNIQFNGVPGGSASHFVPRYDPTNNKVQLYAETTVAANQPLIELTGAATPAAVTYQFEAWGW